MAIYYVYSGAAGSANGTSWANAYTTLTAAISGKAAGDVFYVAHDHAQSTGSAIALNVPGTVGNPNKFICVNRSGSVPPVSADRRATAQVSTTGDFGISMNGAAHYDGLIFVAGNSTGVANFQPQQTVGSWTRFDNCSLRIGSTGGGKVLANIGSSYVEMNNTTLSFSGTTQGLNSGAVIKWRNTASAVIGTAVPTTLITPVSTSPGEVELIGVDLSAVGSGKTIFGSNSLAASVKYHVIDCKLNASVTKTVAPTSPGSVEVDFIRSGSSGVNYTVQRDRTSGSLIEETTVVRTTGGATDGTTKISWKIVSSTLCSYSLPFECPPIALWNDTTGSAKTATIECIASAIMKDDECWVELEYLGDASSPQASFVSDSKTDLLATGANQTTSSETWGGSTTAFKLAVTFTAQQKGWVYGRVKVGKASSTVYIDPLITLT